MDEKNQQNQQGTRGSESVLEMSSFTVTRERAVELFDAAGFPRSPRQISRWCKDGELRAIKQPTKTGIERYVINEASIEAKIEQLRRGQNEHERPQLYGVEENEDNGDDSRTAALSLRQEERWKREEELIVLRAEVKAKDSLIDKLMKQNAGMGVEIGRLRGQVGQLEGQMRQLAAPKPTPAQTSDASRDMTEAQSGTAVSSFWRRLLGR